MGAAVFATPVLDQKRPAVCSYRIDEWPVLGAAFVGKARAGEHVGIYERLGVRTRINAKGVYTYLSGSLLPQEVAQAMEEASRHFAGQTHLKLRRVQILCQSQRSI